MKVFVLVEHYDRGSDEVHVVGVFSTFSGALAVLRSDFVGYSIPEDDSPPDGDLNEIWFYADGDYDQDRVMIVEQEVI